MAKDPSESAFEKKFQEQTAATAFQLVWGWVEELGQKAWDQHKVQQATKSYAESYRERHGAVHVLGMSKPVPLHEISTAVRVAPATRWVRSFTPAHGRRLRNRPAALAALHRGGERRSRVASREPFLNLLGVPGAGGSTFLRRLGQEATLAHESGARIDPEGAKRDGRYEHALLPLDPEVREPRTKSAPLGARVADPFARAGLPASQAFVGAVLKSDTLLAPLDEVCDTILRLPPAS